MTAGTSLHGAARAPGAAGRAVRDHGVNLAGWLVAGAGPAHLAGFAGDTDLARIASWRFTHVRLPVDAALLDDAAGGAGWAALDRALAACERHGLACVLALRLAPDDQARIFTTASGWRALAARWEAIARRYRNGPPGLRYDLLDRPRAPDDVPAEVLAALGAARPSPAAARRPAVPGATGGRAWSALAARLTGAIRAVDDRRALVVESNQGASAPAFRHLRPTRDPKTVYSFHCFEPAAFALQGVEGEGIGGPRLEQVTYPGPVDGDRWDRERLQQWLQPALEFRTVYAAPLYLGAFGASAAAPRPARLTWVRSVLTLCRTHDVGWAYWTYRDDRFGLLPASASGGPGQRPAAPGSLDYDLLGVLQSEA